jgi:hypothetical protein
VAWTPPELGAVIWRVIKMYLRPVEHVDSLLISLRSLSFQFAAHRGSDGAIVALTGFRAHHGVIDVVQLYGEHDADAIRIPDDEPDILFPSTTIWRATGTANDVIGNLLTLADPEPGEPEIPRPRGCRIELTESTSHAGS